MIEPSGPVHVPERNVTTVKGDGGHVNRIPDAGSTRWPLKTPYIPPVITIRPTYRPTTRPTPNPTPQPTPPPPPPLPTELKTTPLPPTPERPSSRPTTIAPATSTAARVTTVDNGIQTDPQKPRGDVFSKSHKLLSVLRFTCFMWMSVLPSCVYCVLGPYQVLT